MANRQAGKVYAKTEPHRAMCEAIWVAKTLHGERREEFFAGVERHRGREAMLRLRSDVGDLEASA